MYVAYGFLPSDKIFNPIGKILENVRLYRVRVRTNSRCEMGSAINHYIFIIKAYLINWWSPDCLEASFLVELYCENIELCRKDRIELWENHIFEYIHIYTYFISPRENLPRCDNGVVKGKRMQFSIIKLNEVY